MKQRKLLTEKDVLRVKVGRPVFPGLTKAHMPYAPEGLTKKFSLYRTGKVYWKKGTGVKATRVFLRPVSRAGLADARELISIAHDLRRLGLPVPHQELVSAPGRFATKYYVATEAFFRKGVRSKIEPFNKPFLGLIPHRYPNLLRKLSIEKDSDLIKELASCVVKIANSGFEIRGLDVFGFYKKKNGKWGLIIHDLESISKPDKGFWPVSAGMGLKEVYTDAGAVWDPVRRLAGLKPKDPRLDLFWRTIKENLSEPIKRELEYAWSLSGSTY